MSIKKRILIADDDRVIVATIAEGLEQADYEVIQAKSGKQAIELSGAKSPDLAILDIRMPDVDGIQVAQYLRENTNVPFIFLSAYDDDEIVRQAIEQGALGYLVKPIDVPQIIPTIEAALKRAEEFSKLTLDKHNLNEALSQGRSISIAIGLIMERYQLSEQQAFHMLRQYARSNRCKLDDLAKDLIYSTEKMNQFSTVRHD